MIWQEPQERSRFELEGALAKAFTPHGPITGINLFAGRIDQVRSVIDTVRTPGLHAIIYGDRGVGKTSLAANIHDFFKDVVATSKVNCSEGDTFDSVMRRCLGGIQMQTTRPGLGFRPEQQTFVDDLTASLPAATAVKLGPDEAAALISRIPGLLVLVIDEFDRLYAEQTTAFADFIKALSDRSADTTVMIVGVGRSIDDLVASHRSVERCLMQIPLQRMSDEELGEIIDKGLAAAEFSVSSPEIRSTIISVSQGFPHFTHLIAQNAGRAAVDGGMRTNITTVDLENGLDLAVQASSRTYLEIYRRAITGTKGSAIWADVVLACAKARHDEFGYFSSAALVEALNDILAKPVIQQSVTYHLGKLISETRGPLLERSGEERRYRYRFQNPMMRAFIIMKAMSRLDS